MHCLDSWQLFVIYFNQSHRELVNKPLRASLGKLEETAAIPLLGLVRKAKWGTRNIHIISFGDVAVLWKAEKHIIKDCEQRTKAAILERSLSCWDFPVTPCDSLQNLHISTNGLQMVEARYLSLTFVEEIYWAFFSGPEQIIAGWASVGISL